MLSPSILGDAEVNLTGACRCITVVRQETYKLSSAMCLKTISIRTGPRRFEPWRQCNLEILGRTGPSDATSYKSGCHDVRSMRPQGEFDTNKRINESPLLKEISSYVA